MTCPSCGTGITASQTTCPSCKRTLGADGGDIAAGLLALGGLVLGGVVAAKVAKKTFTFLKENVDWDAVGSEIVRALAQTQYDLDSITHTRDRLDRVEQLLQAEDDTSTETAALLLSATLEASLKQMSQARNVQQDFTETEGLVEIANKLAEHAVIDPSEVRSIKDFTYRVRNPVVHGQFGKVSKSDVLEHAHFVRTLLTKNHLITS